MFSGAAVVVVSLASVVVSGMLVVVLKPSDVVSNVDSSVVSVLPLASVVVDEAFGSDGLVTTVVDKAVVTGADGSIVVDTFPVGSWLDVTVVVVVAVDVVAVVVVGSGVHVG